MKMKINDDVKTYLQQAGVILSLFSVVILAVVLVGVAIGLGGLAVIHYRLTP